MKQMLAMVCALGLLASPVAAQPQGVLGAPTKPQNVPQGPVTPPVAAPRAPVQQVGPSASTSSLGQSKPGKPTPVVPAPTNTHAQKPKPKPGKAAVVGAVAAGAVVGGAAVVASQPAKPAAPPPEPPKPEPEKPDPTKGATTGAPLPRWAALRSDEVNLRTGPGTRYPIDWVYRRRDLPVQIQREFDAWRLIEDQDGVKGWVHSATLTGRRGFVIKVADQTLRKSAADDAPAVATLRTGVAGRLRACAAKATWCDVEAGGQRGWLKREVIWGIFPDEVIN